MKIYKIAIEKQGYDTNDSHVVVCNSIQDAIALAKSVAADEGEEIWDDATVIKIGEYTGRNIKPFIVLTSFNAG